MKMARCPNCKKTWELIGWLLNQIPTKGRLKREKTKQATHEFCPCPLANTLDRVACLQDVAHPFHGQDSETFCICMCHYDLSTVGELVEAAEDMLVFPCTPENITRLRAALAAVKST